MGKYVGTLEESFADFTQTDYAVSCMNGTAALHLALLALDVKLGDYVIVPAFSYIATANVVRYCGAEPIFCDVDPKTWTIDAEEVERIILRSFAQGKNVVGVIPVHIYGVPADVSTLVALAEDYGLWIVEDAAEAHGARYEDAAIGSFGDVGIFSFYGNKILTSGEGGIAVTNREDLNERMRLYRGQGQSLHRRFWHEVVGYNYRMTDLQAAVACAQLEEFDAHNAKRRVLCDAYRHMLHGSGVQLQKRSIGSVDWLFTVLLPEKIDRNIVARKMNREGIETRPTFVALTDLPPYKQETPYVAADVAARGLSFPTHGAVTIEDAARIVSSFVTAIEHSYAQST